MQIESAHEPGVIWYGLLPVVIAVLLIVMAITAVDVWLANRFFFDALSQSWIGTGEAWANEVLHRGGRNTLRLIGVLAIIGWIVSIRVPRWRIHRRSLGYFALCMALVPLFVGGLKQITNVDCPWDMLAFGGNRPTLEYFESRPTELPAAVCFPGAHSSSAFALFALAFLARRQSVRAGVLVTAYVILLGGLFSLAQQARGAHFLSHDLWSMLLAWVICGVIYRLMYVSGLKARVVAAKSTLIPVCIAWGVLLMSAPSGPVAAEEPAEQGERVLPSFSTRSDVASKARAEGVPEDAELERVGAVIGKILIRPQPIFDVSKSEENTRLFRLANRLHYGTRPATISDKLLIAQGELFDASIVAESERLLRDTRYLYDAEIRPVSYRDNQVDLEVVTRDVWTLNPGVSFGRKGGRNSTGFEIEELNLLGMGTQLSLKQTSEADRDSTSLRYVDSQLGSSWWRIESEYADNSDGSLKRLIVEQPFYSLDTRWSAGVSVRDDQRVDNFYSRGEKAYEYFHSQRFAEAKWGWSKGRANRFVDRYSVGWTRDRNEFSDAGTFGELNALLPQDRDLAYPWFAWERVEDEYLEARNLDQIERTEDVALGWRFAARLGFAHRSLSSDRNALLIDSSVAKGYVWGDGRQLHWQAALTARHEQGQFRNTLLSSRIEFYQRQSERRLFFAALEVDAGHKLDADRQLSLGGDSGLRGYPLRFRDGEGRWLLTLEQRAFTNWYPFRLVYVGGAAFVDVGSTWGASRFDSSRSVLGNVGVGLRLGNSRSALGNVLHIDLAMPFGGSGNAKDIQLIIETKKSF